MSCMLLDFASHPTSTTKLDLFGYCEDRLIGSVLILSHLAPDATQSINH